MELYFNIELNNIFCIVDYGHAIFLVKAHNIEDLLSKLGQPPYNIDINKNSKLEIIYGSTVRVIEVGTIRNVIVNNALKQMPIKVILSGD